MFHCSLFVIHLITTINIYTFYCVTRKGVKYKKDEAIVYEYKNTRLIIPLGKFIHPRDLPKLPMASNKNIYCFDLREDRVHALLTRVRFFTCRRDEEDIWSL